MHLLVTSVLFSLFAGAMVYLTGRRDPARDPRLTGWALGLLGIYPILAACLPKWIVVLPGTTPGVADTGMSWMGLCGWIWLAGFLLGGCRLGLAAMSIRSWKKRSILLSRVHGVELRRVRGAAIHGPVAVGVFHPVILVPDLWRMWSDETRRIVLEHELAHHRRKDPLFRWMAEWACVVNWFNPVVWWLARRFVMQCEFACDASVIAKGVKKSRYVGVLCDLASDDAPSESMAAMAHHSTLERRVSRLASLTDGSPSRGFRWWLVAAGLALAGNALAMMGPRSGDVSRVPDTEVQTRWAANPFPGEAE